MKKAIFEMGESSVKLPMPVYIVNGASIAGTKEGQGPLGSCIDHVLTDDQFGADSWEAAECKLQKETVAILLKKTEVSEKESVICLRAICSDSPWQALLDWLLMRSRILVCTVPAQPVGKA